MLSANVRALIKRLFNFSQFLFPFSFGSCWFVACYAKFSNLLYLYAIKAGLNLLVSPGTTEVLMTKTDKIYHIRFSFFYSYTENKFASKGNKIIFFIVKHVDLNFLKSMFYFSKLSFTISVVDRLIKKYLCIYKQDLSLNNPQELMCLKNTNQPTNQLVYLFWVFVFWTNRLPKFDIYLFYKCLFTFFLVSI